MKELLILLVLVPLASCSKGDETISIKEYSFDKTNSQLMFQDDEAQSIMTSDNRRYEIGKVLRVRAIDPFTIEVANFAPIDIENAVILAEIKGVNSNLKLFKINKISAHAVKAIKYSFIDGETVFSTEDANTFDLSQYKESGIPTADITFDFTGDSEIIKKLKSLNKLNWEIKYHDHDTNNDDPRWADNISGKDIRRFSGLMINMGYIFINPEFKKQFLSEYIYDNDGVTLTTSEKEIVLQKLFDIEYFKVGRCTDVAGQGGGSLFGLNEEYLNNYLDKVDRSKWPTFDVMTTGAHEVGHMLGYSHDSNMTYSINVTPYQGISEVGSRVLNILLESNDYPISRDNYYMPDDFIGDSTSKKANKLGMGACPSN